MCELLLLMIYNWIDCCEALYEECWARFGIGYRVSMKREQHTMQRCSDHCSKKGIFSSRSPERDRPIQMNEQTYLERARTHTQTPANSIFKCTLASIHSLTRQPVACNFVLNRNITVFFIFHIASHRSSCLCRAEGVPRPQ